MHCKDNSFTADNGNSFNPFTGALRINSHVKFVLLTLMIDLTKLYHCLLSENNCAKHK